MIFKNTKNVVKVLMAVFSFLMLQACSETETASYQFEYLSNIEMVSEGKSTFTISVTEKDTGFALDGLDLEVLPVMTMDKGMVHTTPVDSIADNGDGTYTVTLYYLMSSMMGDWDLQVSVDGQQAHFYPNVMMAMGTDTTKVILRGQLGGTDAIAGMLADEPRPYFVFNNYISGMAGNHTFNFFLATRETLMSHVAIYENTTLNAGTAYELWVNPVVVEVSTDAGNTWSAAVSQANGNWSLSGITNLTDGEQATIYVRLSIQGETKTTDNGVPNGTNDYAVFSITPGMMM